MQTAVVFHPQHRDPAYLRQVALIASGFFVFVQLAFLRIGLRHGAFRQRLRRSRLQRWGRGLDVNIPVAVNAAPEVVLETARRFWSAAGERDAVYVDPIDSMARFPMPIPMKDQDAS